MTMTMLRGAPGVVYKVSGYVYIKITTPAALRRYTLLLKNKGIYPLKLGSFPSSPLFSYTLTLLLLQLKAHS